MTSLDSIGQRDELVRQRIGVMLDRLDDLKSLRNEFSDIMEPLADIAAELPKAKTRIAELEVSLAQEVQSALRIRQENQDSATRITKLSHEYASAVTRSEKVEQELQEREGDLDSLRSQFREKSTVIENLERQLFAEVEQSKALAGECKALRIEAQAADAALARSEHELATLRERSSQVEQDNRRLQVMAEEQARSILDLRTRLEEVEASLEAARQQQRALEERLAAEIATRERVETQLEVETTNYRNDRSGLTMKLEAVEHRASMSEQLLVKARNQMRDRDETSRVAERQVKEAMIARNAADRRVENLQTEQSRQAERFTEIQRANDELTSRCDMLLKAMAAKDAAINQSGNRADGLEARIEQLTSKFEGERAEFDLVLRKLTADLENEKSERALLQGALEIARESRVSLQRQYDTLRKSGRGAWRATAEAAGATDAGENEQQSNVHVLTAAKGA